MKIDLTAAQVRFLQRVMDDYLAVTKDAGVYSMARKIRDKLVSPAVRAEKGET